MVQQVTEGLFDGYLGTPAGDARQPRVAAEHDWRVARAQALGIGFHANARLGTRDENLEKIGDPIGASAADVVRLSRSPMLDQQAVCTNDVADVCDIASRFEIADVQYRLALPGLDLSDLPSEALSNERIRLARSSVIERPHEEDLAPGGARGNHLLCELAHAIWCRGSDGGTLDYRLGRGSVHESRAGDEHRNVEAAPSNRFQQVVRAEGVDAQRSGRRSCRRVDVRDARAVEDDRGWRRGQCTGYAIDIEKVDARPLNSILAVIGYCSTAGVAPGENTTVVLQQLIDEMTAGKSRRPGDQR